MGLFDGVEKNSKGLFSSVGVFKEPESPSFSLASPLSMSNKSSTPYATNYGTGDLIKDTLTFGKNMFVGADDTAGGIARNTILGIPKAAYDLFFPTRGFTEEELKNAKPTFKEKVTTPTRYAAEFSSSIGDIIGQTFTDPLYKLSQTKTGSLFADVGKELKDIGTPKTAGEAASMRIGDVVNILPVGSIKLSGTAAEAIARSKNAVEIFNILKGEIPDLADNAAQTYSRILTNIDDAGQVERILNKTEFTLKGGRDLTESKGLSLFGDKSNLPRTSAAELQRKINGLEIIRNARPSDVSIINELKIAKNQLDLLTGNTPKFPTVNIPGVGEVPLAGSIDSASGKITYDFNVPDETIPHDIQEQADMDWSTHFEEEYGTINKKVDDLQQELKKSASKDRAVIESKIDELTKKGAQLENDFLTKWRGKPQTEIQTKLDDLDMEEYNLDMQEEYLLEHPINQLKKYEAKRGDYKGGLPEVTGTGGSRFAREGDQMADELGLTSEEARQVYDDIKARKIQIKINRQDLKTERKALKEILKIAKSQKPQTQSKSFDTSPRSSAPPVESEVEARSLQEVARGMLEESNLGNNLKSVSLDTIIQQAQIPVEKKVNIIDYYRTPEKVLEKIGLKPEMAALRYAYQEYLKELPKNIDKITEWSKRVPNESNVRIFDWLDGKAVDLRPDERAVGQEIKSWLKEWANRLGLPEDNRVSHYITHLFDDQLIKKEFDQDLAKIIENKIAGEVYDPFLEKRLGARGYKRDTWGALDAYAKRATRKVHMDPALEKMKDRAPSLELSQWKFLKQYIDRVNLRPTNLDTLIDNGVKSIFGYRFGVRPVTAITATLRRVTYRAMLGLNIGSALRNLSQGMNTYAKLGEKYTVIGYAKLLSKGAREEIAREGVLGQDIVQDRLLSSTKKTLQKIDRGLFIFFETAEKINRGSAYLGGKAKAIAEGKSEKEAIEYGKKIVRDTQFVFGSIDTPVGMGSDIVKSLLQFQTFTTKQVEFLAEMAKNKEFLGLLRYTLAGLGFVYTVGQAFGMDKKDLIPTYRFGVPPSMKFPWEVGRAIINAPDKYGKTRSISDKMQDIARTLGGLIPAGTQIKKTLEGTQAMEQGKATNAAGKAMFDVGGSTAKDAQAILFGKYAGKGAKDYYDNEMTYAEQQFERIGRSKTPKEDFDKIIKEDPNLARNILKVADKKNRGITPADEKILNMNNEPRAQYIYKEFNKLKTKEEKAALWDEYVKKKIITKDVAKKIGEIVKNPPPEPSKVRNFINALFGVKTASAMEVSNLPDVWIRNNQISQPDIEEATAILFGEISNRSSDKQMLEAQTILNTAFNRMDAYRERGMEKSLTEVLQMNNQYQAYKGKQYAKFKTGNLDSLDQRKVDSIGKTIAKLYDGSFQNNIDNYVFYKHLSDGRIVASPGKLFK